jgi:hypothetical protein
MERELRERVAARIIKSNLIRKISASREKLMYRGLRAPAMHPLKSFLNGTWVGYRLHPMPGGYIDRGVDFNDTS